jgi:DNA polymerase-3 subunit alpha
MPEVFLEGESVEADLLKYIGIGFKKKLYPDANFDILESFDQLWEYAGFYPHEHLAKGESPGQLETLDKYIERVKFEFDVIMDMGYLEYFHIIDDLCRHNTERGAARGSAGGSLLSYLLDVTKLDPIRHGLLFERFLNPARKDLPDIDLDFSNRSISDVKQYLRDRYGHDRVFPIVAYSRLKVASAIEAVARSEKYQIPDNKGNLIKYEYNTLRNAIEVQHINQTARGQAELEERLEYPNFKEFYDRHKNWFDTVIMPLQDAIIGIGVHAAGTIITHENYNECLPVQWHSNTSGFVTQWRDKACEARGYPKFDLLVVKALDCVYYAKDLIKRRHGVEIPNYDEIPLDDEAALEIFRNVQTDGIFQFNTFTAKNYLPVLRPDSFKDLVVSTAVCRKGTMLKGIDQEYAKVKNGEAPLTYYHEDLEEIMEETYGFMIYQETMSQVVQIIGGLSKEEAEFVRKACGKKKLDEMKLWEGKFKSGAEEKGYDEDFVNELWEKILDFTEYSFNKSHSVGYAMLAYYQAYIKSRYPVEYWCGVLEYASDDKKKDSSAQNVKYNAIAEGMEFIYPTISNFYANFFPASDTLINWPLNRLKGIGSKAVDEMTTDGRRSFRDIADMMENTSGKALNKRIYNSLISSGFFDPLGRPWEAARVYYAMRKEMVPYELDHENLFQWTLIKNDIYGMTVEPWKLLFPFSDSVCFYPGNTLLRAKEDSEVFVGGLVEDLKIRKTKYGDWYARCKLIDDGEKITVNMWSGYWDNKELDVSGTRPKNGCLIEIRGLKNTWNGYASVNVDNPRAHVRIIEQ